MIKKKKEKIYCIDIKKKMTSCIDIKDQQKYF